MIGEENENNGLDELIKPVYRGVNVGSLTDGWQLSEQSTKLFCPTIANFFSQKGIQDSPTGWIPVDQRELYYGEGQQYEYYASRGKIKDEPVDQRYPFLTLTDVIDNEHEGKYSY